MQHMMDLGDDGDEDYKSDGLDKLDQIMNLSDEQNSGMPHSPSKKQILKVNNKRQIRRGKQRASSRNPTAKPLITPGKTKILPPLEHNHNLHVMDAYDINAEEVKSSEKRKPSAVTDYDGQSSKVSTACTIQSPSLPKVRHRRRLHRSMKKSRKSKAPIAQPMPSIGLPVITAADLSVLDD